MPSFGASNSVHSDRATAAEDRHAQPEAAARLLRFLRQRRGGLHLLQFDRDAEHRQQREFGAEVRTRGGRQREEPGVQRKLRNTGEERRQVTAHRQARAEAGDNAAQQRLHDANAVLRLA